MRKRRCFSEVLGLPSLRFTVYFILSVNEFAASRERCNVKSRICTISTLALERKARERVSFLFTSLVISWEWINTFKVRRVCLVLCPCPLILCRARDQVSVGCGASKYSRKWHRRGTVPPRDLEKTPALKCIIKTSNIACTLTRIYCIKTFINYALRSFK